jgi:hypothetical protein
LAVRRGDLLRHPAFRNSRCRNRVGIMFASCTRWNVRQLGDNRFLERRGGSIATASDAIPPDLEFTALFELDIFFFQQGSRKSNDG